MSLNLRDLAYELDGYREQVENDEEPDDQDRFEALIDLEKYVGDLHVAHRRVALLTEDEHTDYVRDLYEENIPPNIAVHVDWKAVADDDLTDWTCIEFDGETYYTRDV